MFLGLACASGNLSKRVLFSERIELLKSLSYMYLNRQKCEKRYMIFMKISNKVLSEIIFFHSRV